MRALIAVCVGSVFVAFSPAVFAQMDVTFVNAVYGSYPFYPPGQTPMNNTLWKSITLEEEDLDYYYADEAKRVSHYYHEGTQVAIGNSSGTLTSPGLYRFHLYLGGSPLAAQWVGDWLMNAHVYIEGEWCDPIFQRLAE